MVNSHEAATAEFTRNPDAQVPGAAMREAISEAVGEGKTRFVDATRLATRLLGDSIATNLFMLGYAYQKGLVPVSAEAINKAKPAATAGKAEQKPRDPGRPVAKPKARTT